MSIINYLDSSIQTTSCSVNSPPNTSLNKRSLSDIKKKKTAYQAQKEIFLKRKDMDYSKQNKLNSLTPQQKRTIEYRERKGTFEINSFNSHKKKKMVTFKGNFIQVINVKSYKKLYSEELKNDNNGKCNCFIF